MRLIKKIIILLVILAFVGMGFLPMWSTKMAENAFKNLKSRDTPRILKEAIRMKIRMFMYSDARPIAERAILYFPESDELDYFLYSAALCADKEHKPRVAMFWYSRFIDVFPEHEWTTQAANNYNKLKALHD